MKTEKLRLGLVGKDVSKSDSERIHGFILKELGVACEYERFSVSPDAFDSVMRRLMGDFDGFNVTIPYKRDVMEYLDGIKGDAIKCGAVNTVVTSTGMGYNTDGMGFSMMLRLAGIAVKGKKVLVLGGGGSGRSTAVALRDSGAQVYMYQRRKDALAEVCEQLNVQAAINPESGDFDLLINCTGVGMHDTEGQSPVSEKAFSGAEAAIDLIYVPEESEFLRLAKLQGLQTLNGAAMLFYQAYYADCLYLDIKPNDEQAKTLYEKFKKE